MIGQKFNFLTVLKKDTERKYNYYICECECGKTKSIRKDNIINNSVKSCGCKKKELYELKRTFPINIEFFTTPSDELSYFLGFFLADGYLTKDNKIGIQLQEKDVDILRKFSLLICNEDRVKYIIKKKDGPNCKRQNQYRLSFTNTTVYKMLTQMGLGLDKTISAQVPNELINNHHFWRGVIDGDGCITTTNIFIVDLIGTRSICNSFKNYCNGLGLGLNTKITEFKKDRYSIDLVGYRLNGIEAIKLCEHLYKDKGDIYLKRKYEKFQINFKG